MSVQKSSDRLDWGALRYFRAVASAGTLSSAARQLGVQHTTVARQLDALEQELGVRLFLRNARGYVLTRVGESLLGSVEAMHAEVDRLARVARGQTVEMAGSVRIATADALATHLVLPALVPVLKRHPMLSVEIVSDTRQHDLSRREADLALRLGGSDDTRLVGRRLTPLGFGLYAAARSNARPRDVRRAKIVAFDESVGRLPHDAWLEEHAPAARIVLRSNRQHTLVEAVRLGVGLGLLPCLVADADVSLRQVLGPADVFSRDLWLLVHADLQHAPRVRAVLDAIAAHVTAHARRLRGA